ncbi:hypothetical protein JCM1840_004447 [Sporobolomyces johnsonii]
MSASIAGSTFFSSASPSSPSSKNRRPSASASRSAPNIHSNPSAPHPPSAPSPASAPGLSSPVYSPYPQMAHHLASSTVVQPLAPLTPISSPPNPNQSTLSFASTSTTASSASSAAVSRASSCRSTNSVQAVPIKKPQRGPAVPRIVTRGLNAIGAYGVGLGSPTAATSSSGMGAASSSMAVGGSSDRSASASASASASGTTPTPQQQQQQQQRRRGSVSPRTSPRLGPSDLETPLPAAGGDEARLPRPLRPQRVSSWMSTASSRSRNSHVGAISPVEEGGSASAGSDNEAWRVKGQRRPQPREGSGGWSRESEREPSAGGTSLSWSRRPVARDDEFSSVRAGSLSPMRRASQPRPGSGGSLRVLQGGGEASTSRSRETSVASNATVASVTSQGTATTASTGGVAASSGGAGASSGGGPREGERERERPNAMGVVGTRRSVDDFEFGEVLGEGSYSTVTLVRTVHPPYRQYALKVLDKEHIKREKKTKYVLIERDTLKALDGHPGVVRLYWTFQDAWSLYYVLELAQNGELLKLIKKYGSLDLRSARYYIAQVLSAVEYMHEKGVIHRDLKPENILLDETMRVKITDFGTAKLLKTEEMVDGRPEEQPDGRPRARSFVGTPEYVSPEVLSEGRESSFSSDFWALGCILFQLLAGRPPFQARTEYLMFQKIINIEYEFPLGFPADAKDLVEKLLVVDPTQRLGGDPKTGNGIEAIKAHPFFTSHLARPSALSFPAAADAPGAAESETASPSINSSTEASTTVSTPASSVPEATLPPRIPSGLTPSGFTTELAPPTASAPASLPSRSPLEPLSLPVSADEDPLDAPIDWSTIWSIPPPEIRTGLVQPAPVVKGEFVLLGPDSGAPSSVGTGLTREGGGYDSWDDRASVVSEEAVVDDDVDETASSPTSASGRDLPAASSFGAGKWANVLLPSETILLLSPILQRPSSAAAARSALLRSPKIKFPSKVPSSLNPLNLITSSASVASASSATGHGLSNVPPAVTTVATAPLPAGTKERTLILTDYPRLLCIKEAPHKVSIKSEVFLGSALKGGVRKEGATAFVAVEPIGKDGKGFVVKTSQRNYKYDEPSGQAQRWIQELREAHSAGLTGGPTRR